ncbi:MAG: alpha/beta hydrolase [Treponema sp.]|nr:alpha/beta hydrolase [Treponema sp.]
MIKRTSPPAGAEALGQPAAGENWLDTQNHEDVFICSHDGLRLHACYAASGTSRDTAILAHGYGGEGKQLAGFARMFHDRFGMNVLLPDARGYGLSEGDYTGFGWHERLDILRWADWVKGRAKAGEGAAPEAAVRIVLFGLSMGGATVLAASGEDLGGEIKAIVEDCGYASLMEEMVWQQRLRYGYGGAFILKALSRLTKKRAGYSFQEVSPLEQVKKSKTPTLFIHGEADDFVPFEMVLRLYDACAAEKELYAVPGAAHAGAYDSDPAEYERRIEIFFDKYMRH